MQSEDVDWINMADLLKLQQLNFRIQESWERFIFIWANVSFSIITLQR
jgi:hypothetical protein